MPGLALGVSQFAQRLRQGVTSKTCQTPEIGNQSPHLPAGCASTASGAARRRESEEETEMHTHTSSVATRRPASHISVAVTVTTADIPSRPVLPPVRPTPVSAAAAGRRPHAVVRRRVGTRIALRLSGLKVPQHVPEHGQVVSPVLEVAERCQHADDQIKGSRANELTHILPQRLNLGGIGSRPGLSQESGPVDPGDVKPCAQRGEPARTDNDIQDRAPVGYRLSAPQLRWLPQASSAHTHTDRRERVVVNHSFEGVIIALTPKASLTDRTREASQRSGRTA